MSPIPWETSLTPHPPAPSPASGVEPPEGRPGPRGWDLCSALPLSEALPFVMAFVRDKQSQTRGPAGVGNIRMRTKAEDFHSLASLSKRL